jgi:hypothetical protein
MSFHARPEIVEAFAGKAVILATFRCELRIVTYWGNAPHRNLLGATEQAPKSTGTGIKLRGISQGGQEHAATS